MIGAKPGFALTLAIHPNRHGFGWAAFSGPLSPYDWGTVRARTDKNPTCLRRAERLLDRLQPEAQVLEAAEPTNSKRVSRITKLVRGLVALARGRGIEVATYRFSDVQQVFAAVGARFRHDIAGAVCRQFDVFKGRLGRKRRAWESEREGEAVFSAAALIVTHMRVEAGRVLDALT